MKNLQDILYKISLIEVHGSTNLDVSAIVFDSRAVVEGSLFVATNGASVNGHDFIEGALKSGAIAVMCEDS